MTYDRREEDTEFEVSSGEADNDSEDDEENEGGTAGGDSEEEEYE